MGKCSFDYNCDDDIRLNKIPRRLVFAQISHGFVGTYKKLMSEVVKDRYANVKQI